MPKAGDIDYKVLELDLGSGVLRAVSGPRRPHDRLDLPALKGKMGELNESRRPRAVTASRRASKSVSRPTYLASISATATY